jgi:protein-arginine kinase activator protein McsA
MQCDQCKEREAVVHLTQIVDEQVTTQHLCEKCAAERGVESATLLPKTPLGSFLAAMGKSPGTRGAGKGAACPGCGAPFRTSAKRPPGLRRVTPPSAPSCATSCDGRMAHHPRR